MGERERVRVGESESVRVMRDGCESSYYAEFTAYECVVLSTWTHMTIHACMHMLLYIHYNISVLCTKYMLT